MYSHILMLDDAGEVVTERVPVYVVDVAASDRTPRTIVWPELPGIPERGEDMAVDLTFDAVEDPTTGIAWRINGMSHWHEPMFTFGPGQTVRMRLRNLAGPEHPFHLHGQFFSIVSDGRPETQLPGLHDTVLVPGLTTLEIVAYLDNPGRWMAHCHILEHAELGMMAEIVVGDREQSGRRLGLAHHRTAAPVAHVLGLHRRVSAERVDLGGVRRRELEPRAARHLDDRGARW
ncbi:MAG: multicopper oxidase domain-containing protein [Sandaracinaceae bacterium]|nr:multicopper oxidase domain-containing protein [Sandaracinaceae bacterium]